MSLVRTAILGAGTCLPERVLTNADLSRMVDTSDAWIIERTGIRERRLEEPGAGTSRMALAAAREALANSGTSATDLDLIICATITPDNVFPNTACRLQKGLGAERAAAFDLSAACSGFLYALDQGWRNVATGARRRVLVVGADTMSSITDYRDRNTCILFGDAAGALVLGPASEGSDATIVETELGADGGDEVLVVPAGGSRAPASHESVDQGLHYLRMNGREVFKFAVKTFRALLARCCERNGMEVTDIRWIVPHQVNTRIIDYALEGTGFPKERVVLNLDRVGNTSAASVPVALAEALQDGRIQRGDLVWLVAFGAGLTWGSALLRY